jgi:hypothetical protein
MERPVSLRVFGEQAASGAHHGKLRITGGAQVEMPVEFVVVPRGRSVAYSADVDGDGYAEWVLEDQRLRAVFSARDGGRWLSFVAKDSGAELLPDSGALAGSGTLEVTASGDALEMKGGGWSRTVRLVDSTLIVAQTTPLPAETLEPGKKNEITLEVRRESPLRALYSLTRQAQ